MLGLHNRQIELTEIAELFVSNAITGKRLLLLTLNNLHEMGIHCVGHAVEIYVSSYSGLCKNTVCHHAVEIYYVLSLRRPRFISVWYIGGIGKSIQQKLLSCFWNSETYRLICMSIISWMKSSQWWRKSCCVSKLALLLEYCSVLSHFANCCWWFMC